MERQDHASMNGTIISCNLARRAYLDRGDRKALTGIFKEPALGAIYLDTEGVSGDLVADKRVHGGPRKAAYLYPSEHYAWWAEKLGRESLPWGTLGENLTIAGLDEST